MIVPASWILAHQGGWDELLLFGAPIVLAIVAVRWAERRGRQRRAVAGEDTVPADNVSAEEEGRGDH
jgi:hypothetical protein